MRCPRLQELLQFCMQNRFQRMSFLCQHRYLSSHFRAIHAIVLAGRWPMTSCIEGARCRRQLANFIRGTWAISTKPPAFHDRDGRPGLGHDHYARRPRKTSSDFKRGPLSGQPAILSRLALELYPATLRHEPGPRENKGRLVRGLIRDTSGSTLDSNLRANDYVRPKSSRMFLPMIMSVAPESKSCSIAWYMATQTCISAKGVSLPKQMRSGPNA